MVLRKFANYLTKLPPYNPFADFRWVRQESNLPWLKLDIAVPRQDMLDEISGFPHELVDHRDEYSEHHGWKSGCLHGKSFTATREDDFYSDSRPHDWTMEALQYFPKTVEYFKKIWPASTYHRLRLMLLEPGGYISVHSDVVSPGMGAINIAITQPNECRFVMADRGTVPFEPGSAFFLDVSNMHTVFNDSDQKRWHIIVHQDFEDIRFQNLVVNSYHGLYNNKICDKPD